jgi:hypothetical protein
MQASFTPSLLLDFHSLAFKAALEERVLGVSQRKGDFFWLFSFRGSDE